MRTPIQQLAPSFTSARAYRDWKNGPVLLDPEDVIATVLAAATAAQTSFEAQLGWTIEVEPNEDRPGVNIYLVHSSGDCASLACADNEGETADGLRVPQIVIAKAYGLIDSEKLDY